MSGHKDLFTRTPGGGGSGGAFSDLIGDGSSTTLTVEHGLGTRDIVTALWEVATNREVEAEIVSISTDEVTVTTDVAAGVDALRLVVLSNGGSSGGGGGGGGGGPIPIITNLAAEPLEDGKVVYWSVPIGMGMPGIFKMRCAQVNLMGYDMKVWSYEGSALMSGDCYFRHWPDETMFSSGGGFVMDVPMPGVHGSEWRFEYGFTGTGEVKLVADQAVFFSPGGPVNESAPAVGNGGAVVKPTPANGPPASTVEIALDLESGGTYEWIWLKVQPTMVLMEVVF